MTAVYWKIEPIYRNRQMRKRAYHELLGVAIRYFKSATIIESFSDFKQRLEKTFANAASCFEGSRTVEEAEYESTDIGKYSSENLLDSIKICIAFENFLKGQLIHKGFLVHELDVKIDGKLFKSLAKKMQKHPISLSEYKSVECQSGNSHNSSKFRGMKKHTLQLSKLIGETGYQEVLSLDTRIQRILADLNMRRNELHLKYLGGTHFTNNTTPDLVFLIDYVNKNFIRKFNSLENIIFKNSPSIRRYENEIRC